MTEQDSGLRAVGYVKTTRPVDPARPRDSYAELVGQVLQPMPELLLSFDSDVTDFVLHHPEIFSNSFDMSLGNVRPILPLNVDPPRHSRYRKLLDPLFAPRAMDALEPTLVQRVNDLLDAFEDRGECNFTEEFAELFPTTVFVDLLGVEQDDRPVLLGLRDGILHPERINPAIRDDPVLHRQTSLETGRRVYEYFGSIVEKRRSRPDGIIARLLDAGSGPDRLTAEEVIDICYGLMIAGLDTVSDTLTVFFAFLATHPVHRQQIVADESVIPAAVEELFRWESPVPSTTRRVITDATLPNGCPVTAGMTVAPSFGGVNADPSRWPDGDCVRFDRDPNRHISFGAGVHRCLGSHLARREIRVTLREWHRRIPDYRLKPGHEELEYPSALRHVKDLTLCWP